MRFWLLLFTFPWLVFAQDYDLQSRPNVRVKETEKSRPRRVPEKPSVTVRESTKPTGDAVTSDSAANPVKWAGQIGYGIRTDLADQVKPRLYQHSLSASYGFQHVPSKITVSGILTAGYESAGEQRSEVLVNENDSELFVNDFLLAVQKTIPARWKSGWTIALGNEFPTSPEAKREQYSSVTSAEVIWSVPLMPKKFTLTLLTSAHYIWNRYEYSPATGDLNKQGGARAEAGLRWTVWRGWYASAGAGSQIARYLDGTSDVTYRNQLTTGYSWERFTVSLTTTNGTYLDREDAYMWFIDEYRRTLSLGTRFTF